MKKLVFIILAATFLMLCVSAVADTVLNEKNFPDEHFREVVARYDKNKDGKLSSKEVKGVRQVDCSGMGITSLKGIETFRDLTSLNCSDNLLTELDVSKCTGLVDLYCSGNMLNEKTLKIGGAGKDLSTLEISNNQFTHLDLSKLKALGYLFCSGNLLTELDVSKNPELLDCNCGGNRIARLVTAKETKIEWLVVSGNGMTELDLSSHPKLKSLQCGDNLLTELDLSANPMLEVLDCARNRLSELDLSSNPMIKHLLCYENELEKLDLSNCILLEFVNTTDNRIAELKISPRLKSLACFENELEMIDVSTSADLCALVADGQRVQFSRDWEAFEWNGKSGVSLSIDPFVRVIAGETESAPTKERQPRLHALLIFNSDYLSKDIEDIPATQDSVKAMRKALESLVQNWRIMTRENLKGSEFEQIIEKAFENATEKDTCLFYYAGYGVYNEDNYLGALEGIDAGTLKENYTDAFFDQKQLADTLERVCPGNVIVILDSCDSRSGRGGSGTEREMIDTEADPEGMSAKDNTWIGDLQRERFTVLAAYEYVDRAYSFPEEDGRPGTIFTCCLVQGLGCGPDGTFTGVYPMPADSFQDGNITLGEIMTYAQEAYKEIRKTLPEDLPNQVFKSWGQENTVVFVH